MYLQRFRGRRMCFGIKSLNIQKTLKYTKTCFCIFKCFYIFILYIYVKKARRVRWRNGSHTHTQTVISTNNYEKQLNFPSVIMYKSICIAKGNFTMTSQHFLILHRYFYYQIINNGIRCEFSKL